MKKFFPIIAFLLFLLSASVKAQGIGQVIIQYANTGANNNVEVIANVTIPSSPAFRISNSVRTSNDTVYLTACYYSGFQAMPRFLKDTIQLGSLNVVNYNTLFFQMYTSFSTAQCDFQSYSFKYQNFAVANTLGFNRNLPASERNFYPNPAHDFLFVKNSFIKSVTILDLAGRVIRQQDPGDRSETKIDLRFLPKGIYLMEVRNRDGSFSREKFIKE